MAKWIPRGALVFVHLIYMSARWEPSKNGRFEVFMLKLPLCKQAVLVAKCIYDLPGNEAHRMHIAQGNCMRRAVVSKIGRRYFRGRRENIG